MVVIKNADGLSTNYVMEGCDLDFLDKLPVHLLYIRTFFQSQEIVLEETLEQLKGIERFLAINRQLPELQIFSFFQGIVAYCGELLREAILGEWKMVESKANTIYDKDRYFPSIVDAAGQEYTFSADIEDELAYLINPEPKREKMNGLYYSLQFQLGRRIKLPVKKMTNWFFPPLDEAAE